MATYPNSGPTFDTARYVTHEGDLTIHNAVAAVAPTSSQSDHTPFMLNAITTHTYPPSSSDMYNASSAWRQWTATVANPGPHEYLSSANALIALGREIASADGAQGHPPVAGLQAAVMSEPGLVPSGAAQMWPAMLYDTNSANGSQQES